MLPQAAQNKPCAEPADPADHLQNRQSFKDLCGNINLRMTHTLSFDKEAPSQPAQEMHISNHLNIGAPPLYFVLQGDPVAPASTELEDMHDY
jgi:hypothetical protein